MAHITSIGAGMFTEFGYTTAEHASDTDTVAEYAALTYNTVECVREIPPLGSPANIVNVPCYGASISKSIQGQADAPTLEFVIAWVPGSTAQTALVGFANDGKAYDFRVAISNTAKAGADWASTDEHDMFFFSAKVAAFVVTPALDDTNTATVTLALESEFYGPYTTA